MILSEFERAKTDLHTGDAIALLIRGNYGNYIVEGKLSKIENNRVYLLRGKCHHYKRIISMAHYEKENRNDL